MADRRRSGTSSSGVELTGSDSEPEGDGSSIIRDEVDKMDSVSEPPTVDEEDFQQKVQNGCVRQLRDQVVFWSLCLMTAAVMVLGIDFFVYVESDGTRVYPGDTTPGELANKNWAALLKINLTLLLVLWVSIGVLLSFMKAMVKRWLMDIIGIMGSLVVEKSVRTIDRDGEVSRV